MKKTILSLIILLGGCFTASAQEVEQTQEVFNPHWFVGAQLGMQETLGEVKPSKLISPNAQIYAGYQFTELWALRASIEGWQSKGGTKYLGNRYCYSWNYVAPTADVMFNLTKAIPAFKNNRLVDVNLLAGLGVNIAIDNSENTVARAQLMELTNGVDFLSLHWKDHRASMLGRFGAAVDFNVHKRVAVGVEANANFLSDHYNSKPADNCDWYFNLLAGVKVKLGKVTKTVPVKKCCSNVRIDTVYVTKRMHNVIHDTVTVSKEKKILVHDTITVNKEKQILVHDTLTINKLKAEKFTREIFFTIRDSEITHSEMTKIEEVAAYMKRWPESKLKLTGYADRGTGNTEGNIIYAHDRAFHVAQILQDKFGIAKERMTVDSKGDTVQVHDINDLNRVVVCEVE